MIELATSKRHSDLAEGWQMSRSGRSFEALQRIPGLLSAARTQRNDRAAAELLTQAAWICLQLGESGPGLDFVLQAKERLRAIGDVAALALAQSVCSWLLNELGLIDEGFVEAEAAVASAEEAGDRDLLAFAYNCKATALALCRQDGLGLPLFERAFEMIDAEVNPSAAALYLINIAFSFTSKAELAEAGGGIEEGRAFRQQAMDFTRRAIAVAEGCGDLWLLRLSLCNGAEYAANLGWFDIAQGYLEQCEQLAGSVGFRERIHFLYTKGDVLTRLGALNDALPLCVEAAALAAKGSHADIRSHTLRRLADVEAALGLHEQAFEHFKAYHDAYVWQMGELTRRRAIIAEVEVDASRLRREVEDYARQAAHDPLTGLKNRRKFEQDIESLEGTQYVLGIVDLDRFKAINDTYSHLVGDAVLQRVAAILDAGAWQAYRLGGEEFALLFPQLPIKPARAAAETLRKTISRLAWNDLGENLRVTLSIGLADGGAANWADVMALADQRLYRAKASGRNRVISVALPVQAKQSA